MLVLPKIKITKTEQQMAGMSSPKYSRGSDNIKNK